MSKKFRDGPRLLDGAELAGFIKARHLRQVRAFGPAVTPRLAIIRPVGNPVIDVYVRLKRAYAEDVGIACDVYESADADMPGLVSKLNDDPSVHGIIVQLPLADPSRTDDYVRAIDPAKDVDGLGSRDYFTSATATAIDWLLTGYNIDLRDKAVTIVGHGRLVGGPLAELWTGNGLAPRVLDDASGGLTDALLHSDIIVTATGVPGLITGDMLKTGAVIVDAGTASEGGVLVGDLAPDVRERSDLTLTPLRGGVGPLTVAVLFENVLKAAANAATLG